MLLWKIIVSIVYWVWLNRHYSKKFDPNLLQYLKGLHINLRGTFHLQSFFFITKSFMPFFLEILFIEWYWTLPYEFSITGFIGLALSYGLSINVLFVRTVQNRCTLENNIICVERLNQYMHISSEAPEVIEGNRPTTNWPAVGKVEIQDLQVNVNSFSSVCF